MSPENGGYLLAFDHGTSGFKTAIVTLHGRIVDHQFEPTALINIPGGGSEQDPDDWWRALLTSAKILLEQAKLDSTANRGCLRIQHVFNYRAG